MKKQYRVKRNEDFQKIIQSGRYKASRSFVVYYLPASFEYDRVGISVGKKLGNAVERNKIKRQIRAIVDSVFSFKKGFDFIIIVRKGVLAHDFTENKKDLSVLYNSVYNKQGQTN